MISKERFQQLVLQVMITPLKINNTENRYEMAQFASLAAGEAFAHALIKAVEAESEVLLMGGKLQRVVELPLVEE